MSFGTRRQTPLRLPREFGDNGPTERRAPKEVPPMTIPACHIMIPAGGADLASAAYGTSVLG
ncbi:MAG: hypothetical protein ABW328_21595 [Ilumatobacteraceae bacterium]